MKTRAILSSVVFAAAMSFAGSAQALNLLTNGSLDATSVSGQVLATPTDWIAEASRTISGPFTDGMSSEGFAGGGATPATGPDDKGVFFKAFSGTVANGPVTANLYQDVAATEGATYTFSGWAGAGAAYTAASSVLAIEFFDVNGLAIGGSGASLDLVTAGLFTSTGGAFNYKQYSVTATAPAGALSVRGRVSMVDGIGNPAGGDQAFVVDDFALVVPEPTTLTAVAFAGIAAFKRRRA